MKTKLFTMAALAVITASTAANATNPGPYVSAQGGVNWMNKSDLDMLTASQDGEYDMGWNADAAVGYAWNSGFRFELDLGYLKNEIDTITTVANASGDIKTWTLTGNVLYDFMRESRVNPFIGLGVGGAKVKYSKVDTVGGAQVDDQDSSLALKGIAGVDFKVTDNLSLFTDYQYLNIVNLNYKNAANDGVETDNQHHSIMAGVKYAFGTPAAPAAPAPAVPAPMPAIEAAVPAPVMPAPAPAVPAPSNKSRNYIIFFDFDKSNITPEARKILSQVAADFKAGLAARVELTGHADRSGKDGYNMGLSKRRSDAARRELGKLGIPVAEVSTAFKGESQPMVKTPDGVREPQNRRVEIVYTVRGK